VQLLFPSGYGNQYTCYVGHVHANLTADRATFDAQLAMFDRTKTDETLAVVALPLFDSKHPRKGHSPTLLFDGRLGHTPNVRHWRRRVSP